MFVHNMGVLVSTGRVDSSRDELCGENNNYNHDNNNDTKTRDVGMKIQDAPKLSSKIRAELVTRDGCTRHDVIFIIIPPNK